MTTFFRAVIVFGVAGLAASAVACSSDPVTGTGGGKVDAKNYAAGLCELRSKCESPLTFRPDWGDTAACATKTEAELTKELNAPGVTVPQSQIDTCATKLRSASCTAKSGDLPECIFKGSRATGQKCYSTSQCTSGSCFYATTGECGVCTERVPAGGSCVAAACERGYACVLTGGTPQSPTAECAPFVLEGANCRGSEECEGNLYCVAGKCAKPLGAGATCDPRDANVAPCDPLASVICLPVDNTPTAAGKCKPVKFVNLGEKCGLDETTFELAFCVGSSCSAQTGGTCVPDLKEGETCKSDDTATVVCEFPFACTGNVCTRGPGPDACN
jgi:hypothetical protein